MLGYFHILDLQIMILKENTDLVQRIEEMLPTDSLQLTAGLHLVQ